MRYHAEMRQRHVAFRDPDAVKRKTNGPQPSAERQQVLKEFVALFLGRVSDEKDNLRRCVLDEFLDDVDAQQPSAAGDEGALYVFHSPPYPPTNNSFSRSSQNTEDDSASLLFLL